MKKVAVVILNWNGKVLLEEFLPAVIKYTPDDIADLVVADNGSTDDSVEMLKKRFPAVRLILLDKNYGFAEGYNQALQQIELPYTVLLNSDVEVTPNWLAAPLKALDTDKQLAGVQPKILAQKNKTYFEYAGAAGGWIDKYGYPFCRGRVLHVVEEDRGQYDTPADVFWVSGACFFVRTDIYKKEGGLDANFFAHQEEIDFCWRLRSRGYRLTCIPRAVVYHVGGATLRVESPRKTFLNFRNNLLMLYKNLPQNQLKQVMRFRFWLDYAAAARYLLGGHLKNVQAVYQARKEYKALKKTYAPIRKENLEKTIAGKIPEMMQNSIIMAFYTKGKRTFTDLNHSTLPQR
ncbi:MAG: glycosyltransferase family 2 protein [Tannerella sp.]|jgi:GT2 family glycosyltransferase|nr:glycosyltransferase family 2 protein [Tannerella sp.]